MNVFSNISRIKNFDIHKASVDELEKYIKLIEDTQTEISNIIRDFNESDEEWDDVVDTLEEGDYYSVLQNYKNMASISYDNMIADAKGILNKEEKIMFLGIVKKEKGLYPLNSKFCSDTYKYINQLCQDIIDNVDSLFYTDTQIKYIRKLISNEMESLYKGYTIYNKEQANDKIQILKNIIKKIENKKNN